MDEQKTIRDERIEKFKSQWIDEQKTIDYEAIEKLKTQWIEEVRLARNDKKDFFILSEPKKTGVDYYYVPEKSLDFIKILPPMKEEFESFSGEDLELMGFWNSEHLKKVMIKPKSPQCDVDKAFEELLNEI